MGTRGSGYQARGWHRSLSSTRLHEKAEAHDLGFLVSEGCYYAADQLAFGSMG